VISDTIREILIGFGFQEVLTFSLTRPSHLFKKMNIPSGPVVEVENPMSENLSCLRSWLIPSLMDLLSKNTHVSYPQKIFEVGLCAILDNKCETGVREIQKLAGLIVNSDSNFNKGKAVLDLDYERDRQAEVDMNVAMTDEGRFVEIQGTGEQNTFSAEQLEKMLKLARRGIKQILALQKKGMKI